MEKIILASQSPRRKELLQLAEIPFEVVVSDTDESYPAELSHEDIAMHIAKEKAKAAATVCGNERSILAADTIVICENRVIGKPEHAADAVRILSILSGNIHTVITGVCIVKAGKEIVFSDSTQVEFHELSQQQISFYVDKYKPFDKAGAYAIQEWIGVVGIKKIEGDFYNVMGLPVSRVLRMLEE